jgi:hypothetical protein
MSGFYTYLWLRESGTPYYAGKGTGRRAFSSSAHGVHRPVDRVRILIQEFPSEEDAFEAEKFLIAYYGRIDLGTGCLRNLTDGGEGTSNPDEETRRKIREARAKQTFSDETRRKISISGKGRKYPPEFGQQIRERQLGNKNGIGKRSEEARRNISLGCLGRKNSLEHRQAVSRARKGVPWTPARWAAQKAKISCLK